MRVLSMLALIVALAPLAQAGTMLNPEVVDPLDADAPHADILSAWIEQDAEALGFYFHTPVVGDSTFGAGRLSPDPDGGQAWQAEVAEGVDWVLRFQGNGSAWEFRRTHQTPDDGVHDSVPYTYNKWLLLRDGQSVIGDGITANLTAYRTVIDPVADTFGLRWFAYPSGLPNGTKLTNIHAFTLSTRLTDQNTVDCQGEQVRDCAPDAGFGRDFTVGNATLAPVADLELTLSEAALTASPGTSHQVGFAIKSTSPDQHRTFAIDAKAPEGWTAVVNPSSQHLPPGESATGTVNLTVGKDAAAGVYNVTLRAEHQGKLTTAELVVTLPGGDIKAAIPRLAGPEHVHAHGGEESEFLVNVTNTGTATYNGQFHAIGPAAAWLTLPPLLAIEPGQTTSARFLVTAPHDTEPGDYNVTLNVDGGEPFTLAIEVEQHEHSKGAPMPGWLAIAALALVAVRWKA